MILIVYSILVSYMFDVLCSGFFFRLAANDRGYGHWRFAGEFAVVKRQSECGRKTR